MLKFRVYDTMANANVTTNANWAIDTEGNLLMISAAGITKAPIYVKPEFYSGLIDSKGQYVYENDVIKGNHRDTYVVKKFDKYFVTRKIEENGRDDIYEPVTNVFSYSATHDWFEVIGTDHPVKDIPTPNQTE